MPQSFRKTPPRIQKKLQSLSEQNVVAGCLVTFGANELTSGALAHLNIRLIASGLEFPAEVVPPASRGKWSRRNEEGWEEKRKDLPKESYTIVGEAPSWGGYGTHTTYRTAERYPIEFHAPRNSSIHVACQNPSPGLEEYPIRFEVSEVLDRSATGFEDDLLRCINLLQENVGDCDVVKAGASFADYIQSIKVAWEVLPPGTREEALVRLFAGRALTKADRQRVEDRIDFFGTLNPRKHVYGRSGLQRYFGALIKDNLIVFENMEHGNAVYIMFEEWEALSQRTRTDLLSGKYGKGFERVVHSGDWKERVREILRKHRQ